MKNPEDMSDQYNMFGYEITDEPEFLDKEFGITPEIREHVYELYFEAHDPRKGTVKELKNIIKKYPHVPQFKNYLTAVYDTKGDKKKAYECNKLIQEEHPDYLFGKVNLAAQYFEQKEYDKIPEVLGEQMEIQALYPDRKIFHVSEVMSFNRIAVIYYSAIGNLEAAESRFRIMEEIDEEHPDTYKALEYLMPERIKASIKRDEEEEKTRRTVKTRAYDKSIQTDVQPEFNHPEIRQLYENGIRIDHQVIKEILELPRITLINDLETILDDVVRRYEYYKDKVEQEGWVEEEQIFLIHALFLLTELNATESLDKVLQLLKQDEDLLEFWLEDYLTEEIWRTIYQLGNNQLVKLKEFVLEPNIYYCVRYEVCTAIVQIAFHEPERKHKVVKWINDVLEFLLNNKEDDDLIDSDFISLVVCDIIHLKAKELLPVVKTLFDNDIVCSGTCGDFESVKNDTIAGPEKDYYKHSLNNIYDRYTNILTTWAGYNEAEEEEEIDDESDGYGSPVFLQDDTIYSEPKIGRNNPCPCGSGKKYKKCCGSQ